VVRSGIPDSTANTALWNAVAHRAADLAAAELRQDTRPDRAWEDTSPWDQPLADSGMRSFAALPHSQLLSHWRRPTEDYCWHQQSALRFALRLVVQEKPVQSMDCSHAFQPPLAGAHYCQRFL